MQQDVDRLVADRQHGGVGGYFDQAARGARVGDFAGEGGGRFRGRCICRLRDNRCQKGKN
jgi:hypothetical protein